MHSFVRLHFPKCTSEASNTFYLNKKYNFIQRDLFVLLMKVLWGVAHGILHIFYRLHSKIHFID